MRVDELLPALLRSDPARPRITCYDDRTGERIELSGKVLANWVAKAANLLQEEYDAAPGTLVRLDLAPHWRTVYWSLACWATGATIDQSAQSPDVVVTTDPTAAADDAAIVLTLAALARRLPADLPPSGVDEARDLATYADRFDPLERAAGDHPALIGPGSGAATIHYDVDPVPKVAPPARVHTAADGTAGGPELVRWLELLIATYAVDGSLVLSIDDDASALAERLPARLRTEHVTDSR